MDKNLILAEHEVFETERLILRKLEMTDAEDLFEIFSNPEIVRYVTFRAHHSIEETKAELANKLLHQRLMMWGIVEKTSQKVIGMISLYVKADKGEFAWNLNQKFWGKGLMPEAAQTLVDFAFNELGLKVLTADHFAENQKSGRVMEKIGMKKRGQIYAYIKKLEKSVLCDYWALTLEDYRQERNEK